MKKLLLLTIISILLSGCYVQNQMYDIGHYSIGKTPEYLEKTLGQPNYIILNGNVGTIWVYSDTYVRSEPGYIAGNGFFYTYSAPSTFEYEASNKFWIDPSGHIYHWKSSGYPLKKINDSATIITTICVISGTFLLGVYLVGLH